MTQRINEQLPVERTSQDGLPYLVNDKDFEPTKLKPNNLIIFGEAHGDIDDEMAILALIALEKPSVVLMEQFGDLVLLNLFQKKSAALKNPSEFISGEYTKHWINLSTRFPMPFIGIDHDVDKVSRLSLKESFAKREAVFMKMITKYRSNYKVLVVVGDTHLRSIATEQLGPASPLYNSFINDPKAVIIRTRQGEIE